jgi:hypothetical protein
MNTEKKAKLKDRNNLSSDDSDGFDIIEDATHTDSTS